MSDDLATRFATARDDSKNLPEKPDNMTLLRLYALYKQGNEGDATGERPGFGQRVDRAKWDAWSSLKGTSQDEAKESYIDLVESLK